jgi:hypothetical protein
MTKRGASYRVVHNLAGVVIAQRVRIMVLLLNGGLFRRLATAEEPHDVALRNASASCSGRSRLPQRTINRWVDCLEPEVSIQPAAI